MYPSRGQSVVYSASGQPGSSPCTPVLIGLKMLLLYLIFMRTALFGDNMMLALMFLFVPFFGRIAMLFAWPSGSGRDVRLDDGSLNVDSLDSLEYSAEAVQGALLAAGNKKSAPPALL